MSFSVGDTVGAYRILEELGHGGMGRVYKVEHTITRRLEAMKILERGRPDAPELAERSMREIQVHASLDHPNIAAVYNAFWAGEDLVLVMELVEGCSLRQLMEAGRIPLTTAIGYACQALAGLSHAHVHGVIHRDVSPSNMMVSPTGVLKLTDFGLSKRQKDVRLSQSGAPIGSAYYMSPEQVRGAASADARSDIYSVGAVLYELVTGRRPFDGENAFAIMAGHVQKTPTPPIQLEPGLPPELSDAILRSLAKDPVNRFPSAEEFRLALMSAEHGGIGLRKAVPTLVPRSWMVTIASALGVVTLAVAAYVGVHERVHRPVASTQAAVETMPSEPPMVADGPRRAESRPRTKAGSNPVTKGLKKFWRFVRHKKAPSPDS